MGLHHVALGNIWCLVRRATNGTLLLVAFIGFWPILLALLSIRRTLRTTNRLLYQQVMAQRPPR